jgi:hypothetical protein
VSERLSRRLDRLEAMTPPPSGSPEAWARVVEALETLAALIHEHAEEIDRNYKERIEAGEEHLPALISAKREALCKTEEGREALDVLDAGQDRGGGTGYEPL